MLPPEIVQIVMDNAKLFQLRFFRRKRFVVEELRFGNPTAESMETAETQGFRRYDLQMQIEEIT